MKKPIAISNNLRELIASNSQVYVPLTPQQKVILIEIKAESHVEILRLYKGDFSLYSKKYERYALEKLQLAVRLARRDKRLDTIGRKKVIKALVKHHVYGVEKRQEHIINGKSHNEMSPREQEIEEMKAENIKRTAEKFMEYRKNNA